MIGVKMLPVASINQTFIVVTVTIALKTVLGDEKEVAFLLFLTSFEFKIESGFTSKSNI